MHEIEPYYKWRDDYVASEDEYSPFYATQYSEFEYDKQVYNYLLHPQWDSFGSNRRICKNRPVSEALEPQEPPKQG